MTELTGQTPTDADWKFPVNAVWPESLGETAQVVNQFAITDDISGPEGIYLLFGHLAQPVFLNREHAQKRLEQLGGAVMIGPRGSFYMTRKNAKKLRDILDGHLRKTE